MEAWQEGWVWGYELGRPSGTNYNNSTRGSGEQSCRTVKEVWFGRTRSKKEGL